MEKLLVRTYIDFEEALEAINILSKNGKEIEFCQRHIDILHSIMYRIARIGKLKMPCDGELVIK